MNVFGKRGLQYGANDSRNTRAKITCSLQPKVPNEQCFDGHCCHFGCGCVCNKSEVKSSTSIDEGNGRESWQGIDINLLLRPDEILFKLPFCTVSTNLPHASSQMNEINAAQLKDRPTLESNIVQSFKFNPITITNKDTYSCYPHEQLTDSVLNLWCQWWVGDIQPLVQFSLICTLGLGIPTTEDISSNCNDISYLILTDYLQSL